MLNVIICFFIGHKKRHPFARYCFRCGNYIRSNYE